MNAEKLPGFCVKCKLLRAGNIYFLDGVQEICSIYIYPLHSSEHRTEESPTFKDCPLLIHYHWLQQWSEDHACPSHLQRPQGPHDAVGLQELCGPPCDPVALAPTD